MEEQKKASAFNLKAYQILAIVVVVALIVIAAYFISSKPSGQAASTGDNVSVYYTGSFTNGTVFGTDFDGTPLNFTIGANEVIPGFNNAVIGMHAGQTKNVTIPEDEAYGPVNQSLIISVPLSVFGNNTVKEGEIVTSTSGQEALVESVNATSAMINLNSPLAGHTLDFEIKLLAIHK